jgi:hypothetical protein
VTAVRDVAPAGAAAATPGTARGARGGAHAFPPRELPQPASPPGDALAGTLARAVERRVRAGLARRPSQPMLQRVMLTDGTVAGAAARYVEMTGMEIATGDNLHDQTASLYTSGASGCASLVTRHGTTLRLAHAIAAGLPSTAATQATIENTWLQGPVPPDEVILVFGTDYPTAAANHGSHLVEVMLANSGYGGTVTRHYNANRFVVDPAGTVVLNPPALVPNAPASHCCVLV